METKTIYITTHIFTRGILKAEAVVINEDTVRVDKSDGLCNTGYYHRPDFYFRQSAAKLHAETLVLKEINRLEKKITKLKNLKF